MKQYFNDITRENLELIKQHKEKLSELKSQTATNDEMLSTLKFALTEMEGPKLAAE